MKSFLAVKKMTHILNIIILPILIILLSKRGNTRTGITVIKPMATTNTDTRAMGRIMATETIKVAHTNSIIKEVEMVSEATI